MIFFSGEKINLYCEVTGYEVKWYCSYLVYILNKEKG